MLEQLIVSNEELQRVHETTLLEKEEKLARKDVANLSLNEGTHISSKIEEDQSDMMEEERCVYSIKQQC